MYRVISCGVNGPSGAEPLQFAEKDAADVAALFQSALGPRELAGVALLQGADATGANILSALAEAVLEASDYLVFYFSGHGTDDGVAAADELLPYDDLAEMIRYVDALHVFFILDVCSAGSAAGFLNTTVACRAIATADDSAVGSTDILAATARATARPRGGR